jgi:hypothetical protein
MDFKGKIQEHLLLCEQFGISDGAVVKGILEILYDQSGGKLMEYFMMIDEIHKANTKKEHNLLYAAAQDGMHSSANLAQLLLEEKTSRQAKDFAKHMFESGDGLGYMINIAKSYFGKGNSDGASRIGKWWFNKFSKIIKENKGEFENTESHWYKWAERNNHLEYINLILK